MMPGLLHQAERSARCGHGWLEVHCVRDRSTIVSLQATSPLKLLAPRSRGASTWTFASSFGGGLVAGDRTSLDLRIGCQARCFFGTQASTKVYRNPTGKPCGHHTDALVEDDALLVMAPDPVQAFAGSSYFQRQRFSLSGSASLILVDWFTAGRSASGERWAFRRVESRNEILIDGRTVMLDALALEVADDGLVPGQQMGRFNCVASVFVVGPALRTLGERILNDVNARPVTRRASLVASASPVAGGVVLRVAGEVTETVGLELRQQLAPVTGLLGDDPWARKW